LYLIISSRNKIFIDTYSLFFSLAFISAIVLSYFNVKTSKIIDIVDFLYFSLIVLISSIAGAKLFSALFDYATQSNVPPFAFLKNPLVIFSNQVGFVIYGGLITGIISGYIYLKVKKINTGKIADAVTPSIFLGIFLGRLGCFFNGCCFGKPVNGKSFFGLPWTMYEKGTGAYDFYYYLGVKTCEIVNTQIISSIFALFMFLFFYSLFLKNKYKKGFLLPLAMLSYSVFRFIIEFYRADNPEWFLGMSISQIISIFVFITSCIIITGLSLRHAERKKI
jgi:phosphatidylglycerol:prolipoprotein diacylglycerol transferase